MEGTSDSDNVSRKRPRTDDDSPPPRPPPPTTAPPLAPTEPTPTVESERSAPSNIPVPSVPSKAPEAVPATQDPTSTETVPATAKPQPSSSTSDEPKKDTPAVNTPAPAPSEVPAESTTTKAEPGKAKVEEEAKVKPEEPKEPKSPQTILAEQLRSSDINARNLALNKVLQLSAGHETSSSHHLESEVLLMELVQLVYRTLEWTPGNSSSSSSSSTSDDEDTTPHFQSSTAWTHHVTAESERWANHCRQKFAARSATEPALLPYQMVLMILRNFSFTAVNLRIMAYSPAVLQVLVGGLYECTSRNNLNAGLTEASKGSGASNNPNTSSFALPALQALVHLAPYLDITGQRLYIDRLFLSTQLSATLSSVTDDRPVLPESAQEFGLLADGSWGFGGLFMAKRFDPKEDIVQDITKAQILQETKEHLVSIWDIFPALNKVLSDAQSHRLVLMAAVEFLQEFINHARVGMVGSVDELEANSQEKLPNARQILARIPNIALARLSDLLYIPRLVPGSLDYVDPVHNIVTRVNPMKLLLGYDATVDTDVRDRALDLLVPLLELDSPGLARRLGSATSFSSDDQQKQRLGYGRPHIRLFDALLCAVVSRAGRNEAPVLASALLRELAKAPENRSSLLYIQNRMIKLASQNPRLAHLAMNDLYSYSGGKATDDQDATNATALSN